MFKIIICSILIAFIFWVISSVYKKSKETFEVKNVDPAAGSGYSYIPDKDLFHALGE
jgi:hypothetical protein